MTLKPRPRASTLVLGVGIALLVAALAQYGFLEVRQHQLREAAIAAEAVPKPASAAGPQPFNVRLEIPSIGLDDAVVAGTDYADLLAAPGWLPDTPLPGEPGNSAIAGHRDTFFRHVADLREGDAIDVVRGGHEYDFVVTRRQMVKPSDVAVLDPTSAPTLTLITCYPTYWIGPAPKRLVVQARLVDEH